MASLSLPPDCLPPVFLGPYSGVQTLTTGFSMALWGVSCLQMFIYFTSDFNDGRPFQTVVIFVWVMSTASVMLLISGLYVAVITGEILLINNIRLEYQVAVWFMFVVAFVTQSFFAFRIYKFSKNMVIASFLEFCSIAEFVLSTALFAIQARIELISKVPKTTIKGIFLATFATNVFVDVTLATGLCFFLWNAYRVEHTLRVKRTATILRTITLVTVNSGLWTAACSILAITFVLVFPENFLFSAILSLLSPLYCNSLLGSLNARLYMRVLGQSEDSGDTLQLTTLKIKNPDRGSIIHIETTHSDCDVDASPGSEVDGDSHSNSTKVAIESGRLVG